MADIAGTGYIRSCNPEQDRNFTMKVSFTPFFQCKVCNCQGTFIFPGYTTKPTSRSSTILSGVGRLIQVEHNRAAEIPPPRKNIIFFTKYQYVSFLKTCCHRSGSTPPHTRFLNSKNRLNQYFINPFQTPIKEVLRKQLLLRSLSSEQHDQFLLLQLLRLPKHHLHTA